MSVELNSIFISGNLTKDVDFKTTQTGKYVCSFSIANNKSYLVEGEKKQETSFINVEAWGKVAENCNNYLAKGSAVLIIGQIKQDRWEEEDGKKRDKIKIIASSVQFLNMKKKDDDKEDVKEAEIQKPAIDWEE